MAAKKKSAKKKASKKTVAKKKSSPKPKKLVKKKAAKRVKVASKSTKSPSKISRKKVAAKKKAFKKVKVSGLTEPKGPTIETMEAPSVLTQSISINIRFDLGVGQATAVLSRGILELGRKEIFKTDQIDFPDAQTNDSLAITGESAGPSVITTNRQTIPLSDSSHPRKFKAGKILSIMLIS